MNSLLKIVPIEIEDLIYDYKLDLDITSNTRNKYNIVLSELNEVFESGDEYCDSYLRCYYMLNGEIGNYNYKLVRDKTIFSSFILKAIEILYNVD